MLGSVGFTKRDKRLFFESPAELFERLLVEFAVKIQLVKLGRETL
jgi:hypothetical protein